MTRRPACDGPSSYTLDTAQWEARLRRLSAPFADDPTVLRSEVSLSASSTNRYYTNSEGTQVATGDVACRLFIQAMTKADDGMELPLYASYFARSPEGLPDEHQLLAEVRDMIALLGRLRRAPIVDPFRDRRSCPAPRRSPKFSATGSKATGSAT